MELNGNLVNSVQTRLRIYPSRQLTIFLNTLPDNNEVPSNILKVIGREFKGKINKYTAKPNITVNDDDVQNMKKMNLSVTKYKLFESPDKYGNKEDIYDDKLEKGNKSKDTICFKKGEDNKRAEKYVTNKKIIDSKEVKVQVHSKPFLTTLDIDWLYCYLQDKRSDGAEVPYLHALLEGANIEIPENEVMERNPELEARCQNLLAEQEGKEYTTVSLKITINDLSAKMKHFEGISFQRHKQLCTPFAFGNWNKYIHKRSNVGEKKKEHQD